MFRNFILLLVAALVCHNIFAAGQKGSGGPDGGGYYWIDSDDASGPAFNWVEISSLGTPLSLGDDEMSSSLNLGFNFEYYGSFFSSLKVSSNGFITFSSTTDSSPLSSYIPDTAVPNSLVAPFWDDLDPSSASAGDIYYYEDTVNERFIVQYENIPKYGYIEGMTFQVILNSDNSMLFQYKLLEGLTDESVVGIENNDGTEGTQIVAYGNYLKDSLAVELYFIPIEYGGELDLSSNDIDYGYVTTGQSEVRTLTVSNLSETEIMQGDITSAPNFTVSESASSKSTINFTINPGDSTDFDITFFAENAQSYGEYIVINSTDSVTSTDSVYVHGVGAYGDIAVSVTDTMEVNVLNGNTAQEYFTVSNADYGELYYGLRIDKPAKGSGGPDTFGYTWSDSDEAGGPDYFWTDISGSGTPVSLSDDQITDPLLLNFDFDHYGSTFNSVRICSNGFLSFTSSSAAYSNASIPDASEPNDLIAGFWDDLDPGSIQNIFYLYDSVYERFIVQFDEVPVRGTTQGNTFQMILYSDNSVTFMYKEMNGDVTGSTVGIENSDGTDGLQVVYNGSYLKDLLAVEFCPNLSDWITVSHKRGILEGQDSISVNVSFDSSTLATGTHYADIVIASNDPDSPSVTVPVKLNVYELTAPANVTTSISGSTLTLDWDAVPYASSYKVYSSDDPYGSFAEDTSGTLSTNSWSTSISNSKKFYKVTALDEDGKVIR